MEILRKIYRGQYFWIIAILILGAALRLYNLGFQSLWVDEIFTMNISNPELTFAEFKFELMLRDGFPYLYYFILHFFYMLLGYSVETARLVSVVGGVVGIYAVFLAGKALFNRNAGLIAAFLLAINEYNIHISQDARPYSLYVAAIALSFYRLMLFVKNPTLKNAVWYGIFTGLVLNLNFFGFVNVLSQVVLISVFLILIPKKNRLQMVINSAISGVIAFLLFLPNIEKLMTLVAIDSFWVAPPSADSFSLLFKEFLGNSEVTLFIFTPIFLYYLLSTFRQKDVATYEYITNNRLQFSFVILFGWAIIFIGFLMVKSYTDVSLILARYFTSVTPVFVLVLGIGIWLVRNKLVRFMIIGSIAVFTLVNLFIVKDYYNRVTKTQFREISQEILEKNSNGDKVVSSWGYVFNYYLKEHTKQNTIETPLDVYVQDMINEKVDNMSFWYVDANARPYSLAPELEAYLNANFTVEHHIAYHDTWAKYYKSKSTSSASTFLSLNKFKPSLFDGSGAMIFVENMASAYPPIRLAKGNYDIIVNGVSLPETPLNGENAHFKIIINGEQVGEFNLSNVPNSPGSSISFENAKDRMIKMQLIYDNDEVINGVDRNAIINSVQFKKK